MKTLKAENDASKYILSVIDIFSKCVWCKPLNKRNGQLVTSAFETIITECNRCPKLIHLDKVLEFVNKIFKNVLQKYDIKLYHTEIT